MTGLPRLRLFGTHVSEMLGSLSWWLYHGEGIELVLKLAAYDRQMQL